MLWNSLATSSRGSGRNTMSRRTTRRTFLQNVLAGAAASGLARGGHRAALAGNGPAEAAENGHWYERGFYLLHEDHHTSGRRQVGRDADLEIASRLLALSRPDAIQIHAKGNPGWTTYPSKIGYTPPDLVRDVLALWRDLARRDGYPFSVYYNLGRDAQIMNRRPEWNRLQADGTLQDRALCYHSGVAEQYLWPMLREILAGYEPDGFWFDGSCFTVRNCYCPKCVERFRRERGAEPPRAPGQPGWRAYKEMQRQIYREFVRSTLDFIGRIDPECLVAVNLAYSLRMPERPLEGIAYLTCDIGNRVERLSPEAHWFDALDLPFDLMTQLNTMYEQGGASDVASKQWLAPKPPVQLQQEMAVIVANGGRYFVWDSPTPESGLVAERFEYLGRVVAPFLRVRQPWCRETRRAPDVSLLHDAVSHYAATERDSAAFPRKNNRIEGAAVRLPRLHLNYEMLPDWRLHTGDVRSRLVVVEHPPALAPTTVEALLRWVAGGGRLLLTGEGIACDDRLRAGVGAGKVEAADRPEPLTVDFRGEAIRVQPHQIFRLQLDTATVLLEATEARHRPIPLLTRNTYGQGEVFYAAVPLLSEYPNAQVPEAIARSVFDLALPPEQRFVTTDAPATVEVVLRKRLGCHVLHLVNMAAGEREVVRTPHRPYTLIQRIPPVPACRVSIRLPSTPVRLELQPQGAAVESWRYERGRVEAAIPAFSIHQVLVCHTRKP